MSDSVAIDIWTVMRKELKEVALEPGRNLRGGPLGLLVVIGVFGIFLPLQLGRELVESPGVLLLWGWVPLFLVITVVADAFAGERERHTLETLLASRLSDKAILFGKLCAAVMYGWGLAMVSLVLALITVNVAAGQGQLLMFPPQTALFIVLTSLLTASLAAGAGTIVSLRASSVRQAAQTLNLAIMALIFVPIFGAQLLPATVQASLAAALGRAGLDQIGLIVLLVLFVLDVACVVWATMRFQRARLILD